MPKQHLTPAEYVIRLFGGVRPLGRELKRAPSTIVRWRQSAEEGGCAGRIPGNLHAKLLSLAKATKKDLQPSDLILGRDV